MSAFDTIAVGDAVYVNERDGRWQKAPVIKVTATQVTIAGGQRFNKRHGVQVGWAGSYHAPYIYPLSDETAAKNYAEYWKAERRRLLHRDVLVLIERLDTPQLAQVEQFVKGLGKGTAG